MNQDIKIRGSPFPWKGLGVGQSREAKSERKYNDEVRGSRFDVAKS